MTCYRSWDNWHSYVKHSLSEAERQNMAAHLTHCSECRDIVATIQDTTKILAKSRVVISPPASIKLNVMMAIDKNRYKKTSSSHLFEIKNWGISMVAGGLLLLALNLTSLTPNLESRQLATINSQIGQQMAHPFDKLSQAAYAALVKMKQSQISPR